MDEQMYRGATIWARKTVESEVFTDKPAVWFKIWFYIINKVNHKNNGKFKRGQCLVRYAQIREDCGATKAQVDHSFRWFKREGMLATRKATRGTFVTVLNYDTYQDLGNYRSDTKSDLKATDARFKSDTINKNVKNEENEKKNIYMEFVKLTDAEHKKLKDQFGDVGLSERISALNDYIGSKGTKYKSHYHTILSWERKNGKQTSGSQKRTAKSQAGSGQGGQHSRDFTDDSAYGITV